MELVSPISFVYTYAHSPLSKLSFGSPPPLALSNPANVFCSLFLIHYFNRALVSPLRTPSRSKAHLIVPLSAVFFNIINGILMAAYLSSPSAIEFLSVAYGRSTFWIGVVMWAAGFVGNIVHDEILFNIRREVGAKGKSKDKDNGSQKEHYSIPHGLLYEYISYPNYFCEW
jgi:3-oxo-5-alpha-steroid 4-dehydrogenase 1